LANKIKIVYLINSLNIGGSQKVLLECANNLDQNKYQITIISLSPYDVQNSITQICDINSNVQVFYFDFSFFDNYSVYGYWRLLYKKRNSYKSIDAVCNLIKSIAPEIIHFHTSPRELVLKKHLNFKANYIFTDHTLRISGNEYGFIKSMLLARVFKRLYHGFKIIAVSEEIKSSLYQHSIIDSKTEIVTVLNSLNLSELNPIEKREQTDFVAVYISRIDNNKGHLDLIRAWAKLEEIENKRLYLVGPDSLNGSIQQKAKDLGCQDSVIFTGSVANPKMYLACATIGVFPSHKEGLPLSLLEKMAMELPVIVSDIQELTSVISDGENGITFNKGDVDDLAEKIRFLYANPIIALKIGKNARRTVALKYSSIESTSKLEKLYDSLVNT
jgi:glycosyltransferase involved in cell wall biosynthesis